MNTLSPLSFLRATGLALLLAAGPVSATVLPSAPDWPRADWLLLGEEHDALAHQQLSAAVVERLAAQGRLAAVALEMAEAGRSSAGLPRDADDARVREALAWNDAGWPWAAYGRIVMAAVRAGVLVHGANLPRSRMREAMGDAALDGRVSDSLRARLQDDVRANHCDLLPAAQLPGMTRIQIARDLAMADTLVRLREPGRVVLLVAGSYHVDQRLGVPLHLPREGRAESVRMAAGQPADGAQPEGYDRLWPTPALDRPADPCAELRKPRG